MLQRKEVQISESLHSLAELCCLSPLGTHRTAFPNKHLIMHGTDIVMLGILSCPSVYLLSFSWSVKISIDWLAFAHIRKFSRDGGTR